MPSHNRLKDKSKVKSKGKAKGKGKLKISIYNPTNKDNFIRNRTIKNYRKNLAPHETLMKDYRNKKRTKANIPTIFNANTGMGIGLPRTWKEHLERVSKHREKENKWYENALKDSEENVIKEISNMYMSSSSPIMPYMSSSSPIIPKRKTVIDLNKKIKALQLNTPKPSDKRTMNTGNILLDKLDIKRQGRKKSKRKKSKRKKSKRKKYKRRKSRRK